MEPLGHRISVSGGHFHAWNDFGIAQARAHATAQKVELVGAVAAAPPRADSAQRGSRHPPQCTTNPRIGTLIPPKPRKGASRRLDSGPPRPSVPVPPLAASVGT